MDEKEKVEDCYCKLYCGMIEKDGLLLSEVLDNSFVLIHMTGMRQTKEKFIRAVEDGTLNYYSADHQHIEAKIQGNRAKMTGKSVVNAAVFGGGQHTWRLQLNVELVRDVRTWRITEMRASTY